MVWCDRSVLSHIIFLKYPKTVVSLLHRTLTRCTSNVRVFITTVGTSSSRGRRVGQTIPNIRHRSPVTINRRDDTRRRQSLIFLSLRYALMCSAAAPFARPAPSPTGDGVNNSYCRYRRQHRRLKTFWPTASVRFARPAEFVFRIARGHNRDPPPRSRPSHQNTHGFSRVSSAGSAICVRDVRSRLTVVRVAVIFFSFICFSSRVYYYFISSVAFCGLLVAVQLTSSFLLVTCHRKSEIKFRDVEQNKKKPSEFLSSPSGAALHGSPTITQGYSVSRESRR